MADTAAELQVLITAQSNQFNSELSKVQNQLSGLTGRVGSIGAKAVAIGGLISTAMTKAFSVVGSQMNNAVSRLDTLNNFPKVMSNLNISAEDSSKTIAYLSDKLMGLPTTLDTAAISVQRLTAANKNIAASTQMFLAMNNAILAGGASAELQSTAIEQLSQAYTKGKPDVVEWRSMLMAMPAQMDQIAKSMGYTSAAVGGDLYNAIENGKVSMNDFMGAMMKLNQQGLPGFQSFEEQARNATGGVATSIANLQTAISRGMATIMNAIGQSNIAGFFNGVAKVINTVSNYIAAFVMVIKEAVAWISVLFGGKAGSTDQFVKKTGDASKNMGGIAGGAGDTAKNLGGANKEAKKLKGTLASFDEMNVLQEKDAGGGSGGGKGNNGGAGAGVPSGNYEFTPPNTGDAEEKIKALAEKIKKALQDAFNIDWDTIGKAMVRFWDDLKAGAAPIGKIIGDVWNDYLKPLVTWAGNSLLPAVLNAIGGAIRFIGVVLGEYWNSFLKPFVDAFLVPIAKWTGGIIVKTLNAIGDGLRSISQNEFAVKALAAALAGLTGALVVSKVVGFFAQFKLGIDVFKAARLSGLGVVESLSGVSSVTTGLTSSFSSLVASGLSPLSSILAGVKTAFSSLWAVASAHPLVALIAIIGALLMTNEDFRKSLGNLISAVLQPLGSLIGSIAKSIEPILQIIGSLVSMVGSLISAAITPLAKALSAVLNFISPIIAAFIKFCTPLGLVAGTMKVLQPVLKGVADGLSWVSKTVSEACNWFNGLLNSSNKAGASEEKLKETNDRLTESANKYNDALNKQVESQKQVSDLALSLMDAQDKLNEKNKALADEAGAIGQTIDVNSESYKRLADNLAAAGDNAERAQIINDTFGTSLTANDPNVQTFTRSVLEQASASQSVADAQQSITTNQQNGMQAQADMKNAIDEQVQSLKNAGLSTDQMNDKLKQLSNDGSANSNALKDAIIQHASEFGMKWDDTNKKMVDSSDKGRNDINAKFSDVGPWFSRKFDEAKQGIQNAFRGIGQWFGDRWNDIKNAFNNTKNAFQQKFEQARQGISDGLGNVGNWANDRWNDIKNAFSGAKDAFVNVGKNMLNGLGQGLGNMGQWLKDKFNGAVDQIKKFLGIHSPSKLFAGIGDYMGQGLLIGFDGQMDGLVQAAKDTTRSINKSLSVSVPPIIPNGSNTGKLETTLSANMTSAIKANPIALTVNVGNEKLVDQTINGINDLSFIQNRPVINI